MRKLIWAFAVMVGMVVGTIRAWRFSSQLARKRQALREQAVARQRAAQLVEAQTVFPKTDPRSTSFVHWARQEFAQAYGNLSPEQRLDRDMAIIATAREILHDVTPSLAPEDIERHVRHVTTQLGRVPERTTSAS